MLDARTIVHDLNIGERVGATVGTDQQRITLRIIPRVLGFGHHFHQTTIAVIRLARRNSF